MPKRKLENSTIEVILLQQNKHLGEKYEVIRVKPIFARNVLLPQNIVVLADKANLHKYQQKMLSAKKDLAKKAAGFEDLLMKIQADNGLKFEKKANKEGVLYAQVSEADIASRISEIYSISVDPHYLRIKKKIKQTGEYTVPFMFQNIKKDIKVTVVAENEKVEAKAETAPETTEQVAE